MKKLLTITTILASTLVLSACDNVGPSTTGGLNEAQVREVVARFIDENPNALIASLEKFQEAEIQKQQEEAKNAVKNNRDKLLSTEHSAVFGDANSNNYIVEFFDYNCGYCKRSAADVNKLIDEQKDVKIVLIELPVLGPSSELAAASAILVQMKHPEKYRDFHNKLMAHNGKKDLKTINQYARELDIRDINFGEEIKDEKVQAAIAENRALADLLGIRGTPAFVINDELVPGAVPYDQIVSILKSNAK